MFLLDRRHILNIGIRKMFCAIAMFRNLIRFFFWCSNGRLGSAHSIPRIHFAHQPIHHNTVRNETDESHLNFCCNNKEELQFNKNVMFVQNTIETAQMLNANGQFFIIKANAKIQKVPNFFSNISS